MNTTKYYSIHYSKKVKKVNYFSLGEWRYLYFDNENKELKFNNIKSFFKPTKLKKEYLFRIEYEHDYEYHNRDDRDDRYDRNIIYIIPYLDDDKKFFILYEKINKTIVLKFNDDQMYNDDNDLILDEISQEEIISPPVEAKAEFIPPPEAEIFPDPNVGGGKRKKSIGRKKRKKSLRKKKNRKHKSKKRKH
jgi:hypothetical protein